MNRTIIALIAVFFSLAIFTLGCKKNCSSTVCRTYGYNANLGFTVSEICFNGYCGCPNGLEGDSCQTFSILKYFQPSASWQATEGCSGNSSGPYPVNMTYNSGSTPYTNVFYINGLFGGGAQIEVDIASNTSHQGINLTIPQQTIGNATFYGSGLYSRNGGLGRITLNMDYIVNNGNDFPCTVLLYQQ